MIQVTSYNVLNTASASLTVNGIPFTNLANYWQPVMGPPSWQWQIPANILLPSGPVTLRFSVSELQSSLPSGRGAVPAVNVVRY